MNDNKENDTKGVQEQDSSEPITNGNNVGVGTPSLDDVPQSPGPITDPIPKPAPNPIPGMMKTFTGTKQLKQLK